MTDLSRNISPSQLGSFIHLPYKSGTVAPRLALRPDEAAAALGVGRAHFYATILPQLRTVRSGRARLVPIRELDRWLERNAARALE